MSDPYAIAQLGKKLQVKTKAIPKTLSPTWDESLAFNATPELQAVVDAELRVCVNDRDAGIGSLMDDDVGKCSVGLEALSESESINFVEALQPQGVIRFTVSWADGEASPVKKKKKKGSSEGTAQETPKSDAGSGKQVADEQSIDNAKDSQGVGGSALPEPAALPAPESADTSTPSPKKKKKMMKPKEDELEPQGEPDKKQLV